MAIKTVQIFDPSVPIPLDPDLDRLAHPHPYTRNKLIDLVERGELPRFRGPEVQFTLTEDSLQIVMEWKSREVAQEYVDFVLAAPDADIVLRSVEIIED